MSADTNADSLQQDDVPISSGQGVTETHTHSPSSASASASASGSSTPLHADPNNNTIRSPSPRKPSNINFLGLGVPAQPPILPNPAATTSTNTPATQVSAPTPSLTVTTYPHLANYIFGLLQNVNISPTKHASTSSTTGQHPLSVSSSGESDDESPSPPLTTPTSTSTSSFANDNDNDDDGVTTTLQTPKKPKLTTSQSQSGRPESSGVSGVERDNLVKRIVELLDNEEEEKVKDVLKPFMGNLAKDEILMDQVCLDCMHRRRDDVDQVPYAPHFTPSRARGSPNPAAAHPLRPFTPTRVPSFRNRTPLGRPHSPSPALAQPAPTSANPVGPPSSSGHSSSGSPVISPRMLNAKAATFSPTTRVVSGGSSTSNPPPAASEKASTPFLPSDPWKDITTSDIPPRSASPFRAIGPTSMSRTNSSIAIAAPLFSDRSSPFHSPIGTPNRTTVKMPDVFNSPGLSMGSASGAHTPTFSRTSSYKGVIPDDDDEDEFSPFGKGLPKLHHQDQTSSGGLSALNMDAKPFSPFGSTTNPAQGGRSGNYSNDGLSESSGDQQDFIGSGDEDVAGSGMTPLDVLCSVFTSVPRSELEDALHRSGYDFESAMGFLVSQHTHPRSGASTPQRVSSPRPLLGVGVRGGNIAPGHHAPERGYFTQGGRSFRGDLSPGFLPAGGRSPGGHGGKMCRYFLAGECRRSDCRFSHDIDRALCRFWLRGHCAKGPNCEFLHQLPNNLDPDALSSAMSHVEISSDGYARGGSPAAYTPTEEFPDLMAGRLGRGGGRFDPSRNRFANAVKRATPGLAPPTFQVSGMRQSPLLPNAQISPALPSASPSLSLAVPLPKMSARIRLRPPSLLPTLKTGSATNDQYMSSRSTAIRLGHARNACLARAADAFRRGDGAAAKRFSREGKALNQRMLNESSEAAQGLVKERRIEAQRAIRERDPGWSDDPTDRSERGKECAGGLGVIMGTAPKNVNGGEFLSSAERVEALLDLHTLHGNEAQDIAGQFLAELERENFRGLAYIVIGEEKHVGSQDPLRGASKIRLGTSVKQVLAEWGYAWNENGGVICVDPCRV
ncbi:uncharacterized protein I303_106449 [Kwoniella dejecticola CBS 10117]|uniref:C3H1-type domain-containing protein n=1 Tax=Kwoniella dejecticola CBS 10117 TaxID=1296121 RepID=A0A1A5ZUP0_9TREE|nr:uncharacterized protein I303_08292 [Kwoniella dejecticola CBS 10117]OBR81522.1 hypothetical protein I303_08292 [Kwoniella dejecticola CBS 10117]